MRSVARTARGWDGGLFAHHRFVMSRESPERRVTLGV